jgi:hypothetical protein
MDVFMRSPGAQGPESLYEKVVVLPKMEDKDLKRSVSTAL